MNAKKFQTCREKKYVLICLQKNIYVSAIALGVCRPPHYCPPLVCVLEIQGEVWRFTQPKTNSKPMITIIIAFIA